MSFLALMTMLAAVAPSSTSASKSVSEPHRTISVTGDAELKVTPDEVSITVGVESDDKELVKAKKDNDARVTKIFAAARSVGVEEKRSITSQLIIEPHSGSSSYSSGWAADRYTVRRSAQFVLRDLAKFDALLTAIIEAGASAIHQVSFTSTELRRYQEQARALALKAAQEKATALATPLGMKVGKPRSVTEAAHGVWGGYGAWGGRSGAAGFGQPASPEPGGMPATIATLTPGMVSVTASFLVVFDLE